jgi:hypothetical protein
MAEHIEPFPQTSFIEQATDGMNPLGVGMVRAVYLAQHFGQADNWLTDKFASDSAGEVGFWLADEKQEYNSVRQEVSHFFKTDGASRLATASLTGHEAPADDLDLVQGVRTDYIDRSWRVCAARLPDERSLREAPPYHKLIIESNRTNNLSLREAWREAKAATAADSDKAKQHLEHGEESWLRVRYALKNLVTLDTQALTNGSRPTMPAGFPVESYVREAVLACRPTGSRAFNMLMDVLQSYATGGEASQELNQLRKVWRSQNTGQQFWPEAYEEARDNLRLTQRVATGIWRIILRRRFKELPKPY